MVVCKFFQQGYCKFGDNCKFQHPQDGRGGDQQYGYQNRQNYGNTGRSYNDPSSRTNYYDNRSGYSNDYRSGYQNRATNYDNRNVSGNQYSGHQNSSYSSDYRSSYRNDHGYDDRRGYQNRATGYDNQHGSQYVSHQNTGGSRYDSRYSYRKDQKQKDSDSQELTNVEILEVIAEDMELWESGKIWLFSCYGYARDIPSMPGLEDLSFEEVRLAAYDANASGNPASYLSWISRLESEYKTKRSELKRPDALMRSSLLNVIDQLKSPNPQKVTNPTTFTGGVNNFGDGASVFGAFGAPSSFSSNTSAFPGGSNSATAFGAANSFGSPQSFGAAPQGFSFITSTPTTQNSFASGDSFVPGAVPQQAFGAAVPSASGFAPPANSSQTFGSVQKPATGFYSTPTNQTFGSNQNPAAQSVHSSGDDGLLYTRLTQLTSEEKAQFENSSFTLGQVPVRPPPMELI